MGICGQEFDFSLMNANDLDRFEDANERMQRRSAEESEQFRRGGVRLGDHARAQARIAMDCIDEILGAGSSARLGLDAAADPEALERMAALQPIDREAMKDAKSSIPAPIPMPMNREQRRAQAKKGKHNPPVSYPAPPASRMVERVDAQVSAKQKTERLIDARQAMNALRDDPDAMQQLAAYALQIAAERHV